MWQLIKDLASAAAAFLRLSEKRHDAVNAPDMKANAQAKTDQGIKDDARAAIASGDIDKIRKLTAE